MVSARETFDQIKSTLISILETCELSQRDFIQVYSLVQQTISTAERRELLGLVRGLAIEYIHYLHQKANQADDRFYFLQQKWIGYMQASKLMNNSLRNLSIGRVGRSIAKKDAVHQVLVQAWIGGGLPVFLEPQEIRAEDGDDETDQILRMMNSLDV